MSFAILGTLLFLGVSFTIGRRIVFRLIRWTNDHFDSEFAVITVILLIMIAMALTTYAIGVQTVLGAFVAGVLVGESPILTRHIDEQLRGLIAALFMPVFFGLSGLGADLTILKDPGLLWLAGGLIVIASVGKFSGAFVGGKLGGLSHPESLALACAMNARGSTEVIVASIGLSAGVFSRDLFTLILTMAVVTTMAMPPMLRWALRRLPLREAERQRLEREELDARGFVPNLERLLLAVDGGANGTFASRLAGAIAGSGDKPTTVIALGPDKWRRRAAGRGEEQAEDKVHTVAAHTAALAAQPQEEARGKVEVLARATQAASAAAIADEAQKGYDLLIVGIEKTRGPQGGFSREITRIAGEFEGPLAVAITRGKLASGNEPIRQNPHSGQWNGCLAPRRRDRFYPGARRRVARERALRGERPFRWRTARAHSARGRHAAQRGSGAQRHRRPRRPLRRALADRIARRCRRRGRYPQGSRARRL